MGKPFLLHMTVLYQGCDSKSFIRPHWSVGHAGNLDCNDCIPVKTIYHRWWLQRMIKPWWCRLVRHCRLTRPPCTPVVPDTWILWRSHFEDPRDSSFERVQRSLPEHARALWGDGLWWVNLKQQLPRRQKNQKRLYIVIGTGMPLAMTKSVCGDWSKFEAVAASEKNQTSLAVLDPFCRTCCLWHQICSDLIATSSLAGLDSLVYSWFQNEREWDYTHLLDLGHTNNPGFLQATVRSCNTMPASGRQAKFGGTSAFYLSLTCVLLRGLEVCGMGIQPSDGVWWRGPIKETPQVRRFVRWHPLCLSELTWLYRMFYVLLRSAVLFQLVLVERGNVGPETSNLSACKKRCVNM